MPGDNEEGKKGDEGGAGGEDLKVLQTKLAETQKAADDLKVAKEQLEKRLDAADKEFLSPEYLEFQDAKKAKAQERTGDVNYEDMTPAQIAKHLEGLTKKELKGALDTITKRLDIFDEGVGKLAAQVDLTITGVKHRDFGEALDTLPKDRTSEQKALIETVYKMSSDNPSWGSEKCLKEAKKEMKAQADDVAEAEKVKAEKERKTLTEKGGISSSTVAGKSLGKDEAAEKAWKATFGNKASVD